MKWPLQWPEAALGVAWHPTSLLTSSHLEHIQSNPILLREWSLIPVKGQIKMWGFLSPGWNRQVSGALLRANMELESFEEFRSLKVTEASTRSQVHWGS